jgi:Cu/Ag efflux pump CusA
VQGLVVSKVLEGRNVYDLVVRLRTGDTARERPSLAHVSELLVDAPSGERLPLHALAELVDDRGPNLVQRENGERRIIVQCNVAGRDLDSVVADVQAAVDPIVAGSRGHRVEYGGQFQSAQEARRRILLVSIGVVAAVGLLLHMAFGSVRDALVILANLPLALIGGIAGVWLGGGIVSVASWIGFIALFGIATRNGIMLVQHIRHLQLEEGVTDFREAVRRGALERLNPILMTALATALALIPLALGAGEPGTEIQAPMAQVILWGLLSSTFLNMIVVPALYLRFGRPAVGAKS